MDLLDFEGQDLYFDEPLEPVVDDLLQYAAEQYAEGKAEQPLLKAYRRAPQHLSVLVALYRFYYYQHRLEEALEIAHKAIDISGNRLGLPREWRRMNTDAIGVGVLRSMGMLRFYLLAMKGAGYLMLRLGRFGEGREILEKIQELDPLDRLGAGALLEVACLTDDYPMPSATPMSA